MTWLPRDAIERLTGKVKFKAMCRVLDGLGIRYTLAGTGEPLVRQDWLDAKPTKEGNSGPDWSRLNA